MTEDQGYRVDIKKSAYEGNQQIRRLLEFPDGCISTERSYHSKEAAEIDVVRLNQLGQKELRLQPAEHDSTEFQAYIVSTGKSTGGFGRTTQNATSGWEYARKVVLERDEFECQKCGAVGGLEGDVELHVDHITPQFAGGTDDPENLQTLCRECHMKSHGSTPSGDSVSMGQVVDAISDLADQSYLPAFLRTDLYFWLTDELGSGVSSDLVDEAVNALTRYDRFSLTVLEVVRTTGLRDGKSERLVEYEVLYVDADIDDPDLLTYDNGLKYDGIPLHRGQRMDMKGAQVGLSDFM